MCERQTFSVDFIVRKCKADKTKADIYARVTIDGEIAEISTKNTIRHEWWDSDKEKVKGKGIEIAAINEHINDVRFRLEQKYRELERGQELISAQTVKDAYLGIQKKLKGHKLLELTAYYTKIWESKIDFKNYKTTIEYIERFVKDRLSIPDIYLSQLTKQFPTDLEHYIENNPIKSHDPCTGNGLKKHLQRFKRILNWATDEIGWLETNPCAKYQCAVKRTKVKKLKMEQVMALEKQFFANPKLAYVRDLFIFSCYTGLAFADVMELCPADFEKMDNGTILCTIYRTKSEELCAVPLLKRAIRIMMKYGNFETQNYDRIFPRISNQEVNRCLKMIAEICGIFLHLTFHVARHTFAKVIALKNGIPLETVQIIMGHTKITTTQIYAEVDEEKVLDDMDGMDEKIEKKRALIMSRA